MFWQVLCAFGAWVLVTANVCGQTITIDGVADRSTYTDSATFRVQTNADFTYLVTLNGVPVPAGISNTIAKMDYYDLAVTRTNMTNSTVTNVIVRFIVLSSRRGSPERGLVEWVPLPPIPSTAAEMAGARLGLIAPQDYPAGLEIPVFARVEDAAGNERRVNGWASAPGFESSAFRILRGHGHSFLPPATNGGAINYNGRFAAFQTNKQINIESNTTWTPVGGMLGTTVWPANSRIHVTSNLTISAGETLTIGEGTVVRLNPSVNITNSGRTVIDGTTTRPVVFTATNRVAPEQHAGAWGGWIMRGTSAVLIANGTIMTGSGAAGSFSFAPGTSHKTEQALLLMHSNATVRMTNCALINQAGQVGNGYFSSITWDHCLIQRAITCGEYEGCTNIVNHSALIEFPSVDGIYNATIADADYDDYYCVAGSNYLANSLFGFCKDDAIDSGSGTGKTGQVMVVNCWIESALHEALAWSGYGRKTWTSDSVLMNCGQGFECGWSGATNNSPLCYGGRILSTANSVGARYGDNYTSSDGGLGVKDGFLTLTNSIVIYNYRDVFGQVWDATWNWRTNKMDVHSNWLTAPNAIHTSNFVWDAAADAARLAPFMTAPPDAPVGIGLALWNLNITAPDLTNGIPVRLSSFTTNTTRVDYAIETPDTSIASGTLTFTAGETVKRVFGSPAALGGATTWRVVLRNPSGGELTGELAAYALPVQQQTNPPGTVLIASNAVWKYLDTGVNAGTAWRGTNYDDSTWAAGPAELGFGDGDETREICCSNAPIKYITAYFRKTFTVADPAAFANVSLWLRRDDGGVVYLNDQEIFRSANMPGGTINFDTPTTGATAENAIDTATVPNTLRLGANVLAVEIHQQDTNSSDLSFNFALTGNPPLPPPRLGVVRFGNQLALYWERAGYVLEQADIITGPWTYVADVGPVTIDLTGPQRFFRLRRP